MQTAPSPPRTWRRSRLHAGVYAIANVSMLGSAKAVAYAWYVVSARPRWYGPILAESDHKEL